MVTGQSQCDGCGIVWLDEALVQPDPFSLFDRVAPGEPFPSGECPACGALCQPTDLEPTREPRSEPALEDEELQDLGPHGIPLPPKPPELPALPALPRLTENPWR